MPSPLPSASKPSPCSSRPLCASRRAVCGQLVHGTTNWLPDRHRRSILYKCEYSKSPSPRCRLTAAAVRLPRLLVLGRARAAGRGPCAGHHRPAEGAAAAAGCGWAARAVRGHGKARRCGPLPHRVPRGLAGACFWRSVACCSVGIGAARVCGLADVVGGRELQLDPGIARL